MDISSRFSLTDFLAYLFPSVFTTTGFYLLLLLTPLEKFLARFSILVWIFTGVFWGWQIIDHRKEWGITLIATSIVLGVVLLMSVIKTMKANDKREIRETLTAFLSGHKTGVF